MPREMSAPRGPSASEVLSEVEYPISRDELVLAAAESDCAKDIINFLRALPNRTYRSPTEILREFAEAEARFGMGTRDVRHRNDLGRVSVEVGKMPGKTRPP